MADFDSCEYPEQLHAGDSLQPSSQNQALAQDNFTMITIVHHKEDKEKMVKPVITLRDLYDFVGRLDLPAAQKKPMMSAIKRVNELLGQGGLDLPADPSALLHRLAAWSPAMAGMSAGAFANMKSRLRAAFRLARPQMANPRARPQLQGAWRNLQASLDVTMQRNLSRVMHFAARHARPPSDVDDAFIERFAAHLRDDAMVVDWEAVVRRSIRAWNVLAKTRAKFQALTAPKPKRTPYWIAIDEWPEGLRNDLTDLLRHLAKPNLFTGRKVRKLKPTTIIQYRHMTITLVSAAVGSGIALNSLARLHDVLAPDVVAAALNFLVARADNRITQLMYQMMVRVLVMAEIVELPEGQRQRLKAIFEELEANRPADMPKRSMTAKNRALLERLEYDQRFADLVHCLPDLLASQARARHKTTNAASIMRTALAIDLLLICSMRRENLVSLELGKSLRRMGKPPHHFWIIEIEPEEVKNAEPLRYRLEGKAAALLEEYLDEWRGRLCHHPSPWLFARPDGSRVDARSLASSIERLTKRVLGMSISPHQFRHISAESFLLENPDKVNTISEHFGHTDSNTARRYYSRPKQKEASRTYQAHALKAREGSARRLAKGKIKIVRKSEDKL
ncbi:site-specific integrase [Novosphingobium sp. ERN07]|uniref:site-specific integrase n=1 Tax=Novosphingobium sp. ERN07 TaxID=2726187 RepID=UPI001456EE14|nr:site-specific integrase [Novosphingobium sp. ERN07]